MFDMKLVRYSGQKVAIISNKVILYANSNRLFINFL